MKKIFLLFLLLPPILWAQSADDIIARADSQLVGDRVWSLSSLTVYRDGNAQPEQIMEGYSREIGGKSCSLTVYRSPARMKGTAYLMIEDDLWVRFASTGRVRKLSSSAKKNSAGGSDFSYADMGEGNRGIGEKYDLTLEGTGNVQGIDCYIVEMVPKAGEDTPYDKLVAAVSREDYRYLSLEYYEAGAPIKVMTLGDYRPVGNKAYPFQMEMISKTSDSRTVIETGEILFDSDKVEERFFSTAYLQTIH